MVGTPCLLKLFLLVRKALKLWFFHYEFSKKLRASANCLLEIGLGFFIEKFRDSVNGLVLCGIGFPGPSLGFWILDPWSSFPVAGWVFVFSWSIFVFQQWLVTDKELQRTLYWNDDIS
jgi:hypothetical protein